MAPLSSILQDEKVMYAYNGAFTEKETTAWMRKQLQRYKDFGFGLWGVFLKDTNEMIGQCGITMQEYKNDSDTGNRIPLCTQTLAQRICNRSCNSL